MARIECYISDALKEKIAKTAESKSTSVSKMITQILEGHFSDGDNQGAFQRKVMATLCEIYACVFDTNLEKEKREAAIAHLREIKKRCEEIVT